MTRTKADRKGAFTPIPQVLRIMSHQPRCEVCGRKYKEMDEFLRILKENLDHIFPRRFLSHFKMNPHDRINIISLCGPCHSRKAPAEECLFKGDTIGFLSKLNALHWPMSYVWRAARQYDLTEVLKAFRTESDLVWR